MGQTHSKHIFSINVMIKRSEGSIMVGNDPTTHMTVLDPLNTENVTDTFNAVSLAT